MKTSKIIGITGSSGSGKTFVCNIFKNFNSFVIDVDKIGHEIILPEKKAYFKILKHFGQTILNNDKTINRKLLGQIVFNDKNKLQTLNNITHKIIFDEVNKKLNFLLTNFNYSFIVIDAAILIQLNLHKLTNQIWLIKSDINKQIERIIKRDKISKDLALKRINLQQNFDDIKNYIDFIVFNNEENKTIQIITNKIKQELN